MKWFLVPIGCFLILGACSEPPVAEEILRPVRTLTVYATGGERSRSFTGIAQADVESQLSFKVGGTVRELPVKVGDTVKTGQTIARLDMTDFDLRVQQADASLASAEAEARNAASNYERVRQLFENRNVSKKDLEAARAGSESAAAQVRALQTQQAMARSESTYATLTAPVDGAIASVDVEINENVNPGQAVVQLSSGKEMSIRVDVPEVLIAQVVAGQDVKVGFDALPDQKFDGKVISVGVSAGTATTYPVKVQLSEVNNNLRPGMAAEVGFTFNEGQGRSRFLLPPFCVREDRQGRYVYTVSESEEEGVELVKRKAVTIGDLTENGLEVFEGLVDGDRVVNAGMSQLQDGQRVRAGAR